MQTLSISCKYLSPLTKDTLLPEFLNSLTKKRRTAEEYRNNICLLCNTLRKDFLDINETDALNYFGNLTNKYHQGELTRKTIHGRLACYRSFCLFIAEKHGELEFKNPFIHIGQVAVDNSVSVNNIPSIEEMDAIMTEAKNFGYPYFVILALISRCGLTVSETISLSENQIVSAGGRMALRFENKNDTQSARTMILPDDIAEILSKHLSMLTTKDEAGHLFYNKHNRRMTLTNIDTAVERIVSAALPEKEKHYTAKDLRTHAIMEFRKAGVSPEDAASYVGMSERRVSYYYVVPVSACDCPANLTNYRLNS